MGTTYSYLVVEETFTPSERCPHHHCRHRRRHRHRHYYRHHCHAHCNTLRHCHHHSCCGRHEREEITHPKPGTTIIHTSTAVPQQQPNSTTTAPSQVPPPPPPPAAAAHRMFLVHEAPQERAQGMLVIPDGAEVHVKQKEKRGDVLGLRGSDGTLRYLCDAEGRYLRADHEGWVWVQELGGHVWVQGGRISQPPPQGLCP